MRRIILFAGFAALLFVADPALAQQAAPAPLAGGFDKWDANKDGFWDAAELANAFRGVNAKPIEDKAGVKDAHPDHQFLALWDKDKDGKISKDEYEKYEQKLIADLKSAANRPANFTPNRRPNYRTTYSHRGNRGRGFSSSPYTSMLRYQQRAYQQQRQFYSAQRRYASYSPNGRGGYRGAMAHRGRRR